MALALFAAAPAAAQEAEVWAVGDAATPNDGARRLAAYIRMAGLSAHGRSPTSVTWQPCRGHRGAIPGMQKGRRGGRPF